MCARQPRGPVLGPDQGAVEQVSTRPEPCAFGIRTRWGWPAPRLQPLCRPGAVPGRPPHWSFPGLGLIRLEHARVVLSLSLSLKHTLLSFLVQPKCPRCPLKPPGGPAPCLRGFPLLGSCVQRVSVSSGVCPLHADLGCVLQKWPNEYSLLESYQK